MNRGLIKVTDQVLNHHWDLFRLIFKDFRPTHIEFRHWEGDLWYYYGVSKLFDEVKEGEIIPEYLATFTQEKDKVTYTIERA